MSVNVVVQELKEQEQDFEWYPSTDEMFAVIEPAIKELHPEDEREAYLLKIVSVYQPLPDYDEQMKLLFRWGAGEQDLWKVQTSYIPPEP